MRKIMLFLVILIIGGATLYIFRGQISKLITEKKDVAVEYAVKKVAERYPIPEKVQNDIINISKKTDPKLLMEFLKDPTSFVKGSSQKATEFMKSDEGKRLMDYFNKYMKDKNLKQ
jgi:hypothetical protein